MWVEIYSASTTVFLLSVDRKQGLHLNVKCWVCQCYYPENLSYSSPSQTCNQYDIITPFMAVGIYFLLSKEFTWRKIFMYPVELILWNMMVPSCWYVLNFTEKFKFVDPWNENFLIKPDISLSYVWPISVWTHLAFTIFTGWMRKYILPRSQQSWWSCQLLWMLKLEIVFLILIE